MPNLRRYSLSVAVVIMLALTASLLTVPTFVATGAIAAPQRKTPGTIQKVPATAHQRPPTYGALCYYPTPYAPTKTTMTGNFLCTGQVVTDRSGRRLCLLCGIGPPNSGGKCVSCKAGYHVGHGGKCCPGSANPLPAPK
jgi:hypothetical protein